MKKVIVDTNIILLDANNLFKLADSGYTIVLPETVLEECDNKKSGLNEVAFQAREFGRILTRGIVKEIVKDTELGYVKTVIEIDEVTVEVVSLSKYVGDRQDTGYNDQKIIQVAQLITEIDADSEVVFASNDVMARLRALTVGLTVIDFKDVECTGFEFTKHMIIEDVEVFRLLHNTKIEEVDPEHKTENYNYVFTNDELGYTKIGTISNGAISIIGKDSEKEIRLQKIRPMNTEQLLLSKAIQDPTIDIVVSEAKAGSGKTAVALSNAIRLVELGKYQGIVYIRNSVNDLESAEEVGYLSGNDEKFAVYLHPLHDTLDFIVRHNCIGGKLKGQELEDKIAEEIDKLVNKCNIEGMTGLGLRGRTFNDVIMIVDEAQNLSKSSLQKTLTRIGKNSKLIVIGSNRQIDHPYITKYTNGLSVLLDACRHSHDNVKLYAIQLDKVVRGRIAEFAEGIFSSQN